MRVGPQGRRAHLFYTQAQKLVRRIASTKGAGAALLLPALGRGFSINEDGSVTAFDLTTLATLRRVPIATDADAASYDPVTGRMAVVSSDSRKVTFVNPRSLAVIGAVALENREGRWLDRGRARRDPAQRTRSSRGAEDRCVNHEDRRRMADQRLYAARQHSI